MTGDDITITHRYGGHGGINTEWEIRAGRDRSPRTYDMICTLPKYEYIQHVGPDYGGHRAWVFLPQGLRWSSVASVVMAFIAGDEKQVLRALDHCDKAAKALKLKKPR